MTMCYRNTHVLPFHAGNTLETSESVTLRKYEFAPFLETYV